MSSVEHCIGWNWNAVEVTGDLDYDIVVPEEEGGSRSNPMSEVEIVQAESLEEELDAEKDYEEMEVGVMLQERSAVMEVPAPNEFEQDVGQPEEQEMEGQLQLAEEDGMQMAEQEGDVSGELMAEEAVANLVQEEEVLAEMQTEDEADVQMAEQEGIISPDLAARESSPAITVVSDSEPEVIAWASCFFLPDFEKYELSFSCPGDRDGYESGL